MNESLRKIMSFFGLVASQDDIEGQKWNNEQERKLESGEEIEPPWARFNPEMSPWELRHESWLVDI